MKSISTNQGKDKYFQSFLIILKARYTVIHITISFSFAIEYGVLRQFQRIRNNEVCEARGGDCKRLMDLFAKHFKKPKPIPSDIFTDINYANDINWMIMSSEGTGKITIPMYSTWV